MFNSKRLLRFKNVRIYLLFNIYFRRVLISKNLKKILFSIEFMENNIQTLLLNLIKLKK